MPQLMNTRRDGVKLRVNEAGHYDVLLKDGAGVYRPIGAMDPATWEARFVQCPACGEAIAGPDQRTLVCPSPFCDGGERGEPYDASEVFEAANLEGMDTV